MRADSSFAGHHFRSSCLSGNVIDFGQTMCLQQMVVIAAAAAVRTTTPFVLVTFETSWSLGKAEKSVNRAS